MIWGYLIEFHGLCVNASGHFNALQAGLGFTAPARLSSINYCNCWIGQLQVYGEIWWFWGLSDTADTAIKDSVSISTAQYAIKHVNLCLICG